MSDTSAALAPHVYEVAAAAYGSLRVRGRSQSVIINGESGAGKTETTKIILRFLTHAAGGGGEELARRIHESSPVLEAFGNCKTLRNDNSSRFGKFLRLHFTSGGALCGGSVERYLLEKSRVVQQEPGERSFHAFYHLCAGASDAERARLQLRSPKVALKPLDVCRHRRLLALVRRDLLEQLRVLRRRRCRRAGRGGCWRRRHLGRHTARALRRGRRCGCRCSRRSRAGCG